MSLHIFRDSTTMIAIYINGKVMKELSNDEVSIYLNCCVKCKNKPAGMAITPDCSSLEVLYTKDLFVQFNVLLREKRENSQPSLS